MLTQNRLPQTDTLVQFTDKDTLRKQIDDLLAAAGVALDPDVAARQAQEATHQSQPTKRSWFTRSIVEARDE